MAERPPGVSKASLGFLAFLAVLTSTLGALLLGTVAGMGAEWVGIAGKGVFRAASLIFGALLLIAFWRSFAKLGHPILAGYVSGGIIAGWILIFGFQKLAEDDKNPGLGGLISLEVMAAVLTGIFATVFAKQDRP